MSPSKRPEPRQRAAGSRPSGADETGRPVACPHCGSTDVELEAAFGSQLMTSQYWCRGCRTVFEHLKIDPDEAPGGWLET
ncbi:MAG: hypothetical protein ABR527_10430 [Gemmatimonadota bacterium]